jgi:hypothetical protein
LWYEHDYEVIEGKDEQVESKKNRECFLKADEGILKMPLINLLDRPHFMYFLQFHNPNLYLVTDRYPTDQIIIIDNQEYYLGNLPRRNRGEYIVYNIKTKKLRYGNSLKSNIIKEVKFDDNDEICEVFVGGV